MNQNLRKISEFLQQDGTLSAEEKASLSKAVADAEKELEITAFKLERTEKVKRTTAILLEETIEELEQKRKSVEAQNRELEIETSLERVRTVAMGMQNPAEMADVCRIISEQLEFLKVKDIRNVQTAVIDESKGTYVNYEYYARHDELLITEVSYKTHHLQEEFAMRMLKGAGEFFSTSLIGQKVKDWYEYQKTTNQFADSFLEEAETLNYYMFSLGPVALGISTYSPLKEEEINLFKRFRNVFELAYRRFLDIQKADAQAHEAQIQLALERVRARTMAMQQSDELSETVTVLFHQFNALGESPERMAIEIVNEKENVFEIWATQHGGSQLNQLFKASLDEPHVMQKMYKAWKEQTKSITIDLKGKELEEYFQYLKKEGLPVQREIFGTRRVQNVATFSKGILTIITPEPKPQATIDLLERFAAVFEQTYTRFLDLQKAEAQAREAQIEAALERVRSRTMGMQRSDELQEAAVLLFQQVVALGVPAFGTGFNIWDDDRKFATAWMGGEDRMQPPFKTSSSEDIFLRIYEAAQKGESLYVEEQGGEALKTHYEYMNSIPVFKEIADKMTTVGQTFPKFQIMHCAFFSQGYLMFISFEPVPDAYDIFKRFAKVFEQTYTRFLDLQKAELQAREAQIEAALEKVRGRAMAMHNSNDVSVTASLVFTELRKLGINPVRCGVGLLVNGNPKAQLYSATSSADGDSLSLVGWVELSGHPVLQGIYDNWLKQEDYFPQLTGEQLKLYYEKLLSGLYLPSVPDWTKGEKQYGHFLTFSFASLYAWSDTPYDESEIKILKRFASVIDLTFRRYIELQKSEAQAREAIKASSLDRVRAEIASMRSVDDLQRITPLIWHELIALGVPFVRCGVFIINEETAHVQAFLSAPDGHSLAALDLPFDSSELTKNSVNNWRKGLIFKTHWNKEEFLKWMQSMVREGQVKNTETYQGASAPPESLDLHFVPFAQGMLYVGNILPLTRDELDLVKSLAEAFSIAYARYEDFKALEIAKKSIETTLSDLKAAQSQLVQSEKMASLGELTAGIAHEIQNPLNFVNNFSEVSTELVDEMKDELAAGNWQLANELADDVKQNLEKINHHGKRAADIVKGMLQHSRNSSGTKEPTNINALADEYLRLAYHGLRAKDKSFNATMKTDFDPSIGKINIIPQDIGRVILNLITNAFYAVNEKNASPSSATQKYEPTVTVSTISSKSPSGDLGALISVKDNGNGIPQKVLDKIFQPFFTTKPTGQGTGLGLSLAYDIVKAHGGELKVENMEGEGVEMKIIIPI